MMTEARTVAEMRSEQSDEQEFSILQFLQLLWVRRKLIFGVPLAAAAVAGAISLALPNYFRSSAKLLPPQQAQSSTAALLSQLGGVAGAAAGAIGVKSPNDLYIGMLRSRTLADKIIATYDLKAVYGTDSQQKAREKLEDSTFVSAGKDGLITIEVEDKDPRRVALMANSYVTELINLTRVIALTEASQRRLFYERQLEQAKNNLANAEVALKGALDARGVISVDSESRSIVETVARIRAQISAKESQLAAMRAFVTESNPEFQRANEELKGLRAERSKLENGRGAVAGDDSAPEKQVGLQNIKILRDVKYYQMLYELLAKQYEVARLDEAKDSSVIQVLDPAIQPENKFKPKRALIVLLTAIVTLFGTIAFLLAMETWRKHRVRSKY